MTFDKTLEDTRELLRKDGHRDLLLKILPQLLIHHKDDVLLNLPALCNGHLYYSLVFACILDNKLCYDVGVDLRIPRVHADPKVQGPGGHV